MEYALDACALLAFLNDEEGAAVIEELLDKSLGGACSISMSVVNLLEVYYAELREKGAEIARVVLDVTRHYSIHIVDTITERAFHEAARIKASWRCSLADAIGLAAAFERSAQFVTSDHKELEPVAAGENLSVLWLPSRPKK